MRGLLRAVWVGLAVASAGCQTATAPSGADVKSCGTGTFTGTLTATINGGAFVATCLTGASYANQIVAIGGTDVSASNLTTFQNLALAVVASGPGTYQLNPNGNNAAYSVGGTESWGAGGTFGGSGTVIITALSSTGASGTFAITMVAGPGGSGPATITSGTFSITF